MAFNETIPGVTNAADTSRDMSQNVWRCVKGWDTIGSRPGRGVKIADDFEQFATVSGAAAIGNIGKWAAWAASGQTMVDGIEEGGVAKMDGGTANKSTILTSNSASFRFTGASTAYSYTGGNFAMEMRIALGSVAASQQGVFFGLCDNTSSQINSSDTTVIASGGNTLTTTKNLIGFFNRTTTCPSDFSVVYQPAGGTAVYPTGLTTPITTVAGSAMSAYAASTSKGHGTGFVKLGMTFEPNPQGMLQAPATCPSGQTAGVLYRPVIKFFVNGVQAAAFLHGGIIQAATFPVNCLFAPVFNYMNIAGGTAPIYLDWLAFAQEPSF